MAVDLLAGLTIPTPEEVQTMRLAAGHSQAAAADLAGLAKPTRWSEYERGIRQIDLARWALYLLAIGRHPGAAVSARV